MRNNGNGRHTYTSLSKAWSLAVVEKCCSRIDTVPVSATWPQPQNNATPEKQRMVATSEAYGTPPRHLMQHSKQPKQNRENRRNVISKKQIMRKRTSVLHLVKATGTKRPRHWHAKQKSIGGARQHHPLKQWPTDLLVWTQCPESVLSAPIFTGSRDRWDSLWNGKRKKITCLKWSIATQLLTQSSPRFSITNRRSTSYTGTIQEARKANTQDNTAFWKAKRHFALGRGIHLSLQNVTTLHSPMTPKHLFV